MNAIEREKHMKSIKFTVNHQIVIIIAFFSNNKYDIKRLDFTMNAPQQKTSLFPLNFQSIDSNRYMNYFFLMKLTLMKKKKKQKFFFFVLKSNFHDQRMQVNKFIEISLRIYYTESDSVLYAVCMKYYFASSSTKTKKKRKRKNLNILSSCEFEQC